MTDKITIKSLKGSSEQDETILPFRIKQMAGAATGDFVAMLTTDGRLFSLPASNPHDTRIIAFASQTVYPLRSVCISSSGNRIGAIDNTGKLWIEEGGTELYCVCHLCYAVYAVVSETTAAVIDSEGVIWIGAGKEKMKQLVPRDNRRFSALCLSSTQLLAITRTSGLLCRFSLSGEEDLHFKNIVIPACSEEHSSITIIPLPGTNGDDFIIFNEKAQRIYWLRVGLESPWTKEIALPEGFVFESISVSIFTMYLTSAQGHVYGVNWDHLKDEWLNIWPGAPNLIESDLRHFETTATHSVSVTNDKENAFASRKDELLDVMNEINAVRRETSELRMRIKDLRSTTDLPPLPSQKALLRDALKRKVEEARILEDHAATVEKLSFEIDELKNAAAAARQVKSGIDQEILEERDSASSLEIELHILIKQRDKLNASINAIRPKLQSLHDELQVIIDSSSKESREKQLSRIDEAIVSITREVELKKKQAEHLRKLPAQWEKVQP